MAKINIYLGKTNAETVIIFEHVKDKKIIVLSATDELKEYYNELIKNNNLNRFYDISDEHYDADVLDEYETELITSYYEDDNGNVFIKKEG